LDGRKVIEIRGDNLGIASDHKLSAILLGSQLDMKAGNPLKISGKAGTSGKH
jgi:hypothetical protein